MNQPRGKAPDSPYKTLIIAIVVVFGIIAVVFLGLKKKIDFSFTAKPKEGEFSVELKTEKGPGQEDDSKREGGVTIRQESKIVEGELTGIKATNRSAEDLPESIKVEQNIDTVKEGGSVTGLDLSRKTLKE